MDLNHFGLRARPFRTSPDVDAYYPATTHELILAEARRGLEDQQGLLVIQGEPGTGKTLLAHLLLQNLPERSRSVFLTHGSFAQRTDLLQGILYDLGLPYQGMAEQELRLALTDSCLEHFRRSGRTVIVIDEAHLLSASLLEELRLLSNLEGKEGKAVQIVLLGLPSLAETLDDPGLVVFRQRMVNCGKLEPLKIDESADYLLHQIRVSGGCPESLLGEDVLDILSHASRGIPRLLNQAAHLAFSLAQQAGSSTVDAEAAVEAVTRLGLDDGATDEAPDIVLAGTLPTEAETLNSSSPAASYLQKPAQHDAPPTYIYGVFPANNPDQAHEENSRDEHHQRAV